MPPLSDRQRRDHRPAGFLSLEKLAPWLVSFGVHAVVLLSVISAAAIVSKTEAPPEAVVPEAAWMPPVEHRVDCEPLPTPLAADTAALPAPKPPQESPPKAKVAADRFQRPAVSHQTLFPAIGRFSTLGGALAAVPQTSFFGAGGYAHHVVYVIDRSGSMVLAFEDVRREVLRSIGRLGPDQDFHVVLFAEGKAVELPAGRLVQATRRNKLAAAEFLGNVTLGPGTTVLPALERAFEVLSRADPARPGKLIYLLTDGEFKPGAGQSSTYRLADGREVDGAEAVIAWLDDHNRRANVCVNTYLYQYDPADGAAKMQRAVRVMRRIAERNHGKFRLIKLHE